ncbi:HAMP domain-containing protein [Krasilnikovia cinnamomea]|uniref:histidine kinase n=1 Tax=Krasilnikovia cinnamomea TaxID=349313 RepID=A0A4Q7ZLI3_9ACTN|nr:ATP-binding protein [Krasilnikovia cinnamomea]RZU51832.1 HAMP domain-containing protein [Krasilnikovia cinnamomea]
MRVPALRRRQRRPVTVAGLLKRAFAALVVVIVIGGTVGVIAAGPAYRSANRELAETARTRTANQDVRAALARAALALYGYQLTGEVPYRFEYQSARSAYDGALERLGQVASPEDAAYVEDLRQNGQNWWDLADPQVAAPSGARPTGGAVAATQVRYARTVAASQEIDRRLSARNARAFKTIHRLNAIGLVGLTGLTLLGMAVVALVGSLVTRRITSPLRHVAAAVEELSRGHGDARVTITGAPVEIMAVAAAVNKAAGQEFEERRMLAESQRLAVAIRRHMSRAGALSTAARGMGELLGADHVVIMGAPGGEEDAVAEVWSAPDAVGDPTTLARTPVNWTLPDAGVFVAAAVPDGGETPPEAERAALRAAGAGPVITIAFGEGDSAGHVTVVRRAGGPAFTPFDVQFVTMVAGALSRALTQARLFEREHRLVDRLQEVDAAKTEFLSTVSHELRTPLTSVTGYLEVLLDQDAGPLTSGQERMLRVIERNAERLRSLIEDLLIVSRIESGSFALHTVSVDSSALVATACLAFEPAAVKAGVTLVCVAEGPLPVRGDPEQLDRVLMNLLSNAVKFSPDGGTVTVAARAEGDDILITVRDTGIGIPAEEVPHLFTRFFRASNATRREIAGTGLGLPIVAAIVDRHGGTITVATQEGEGTTITVRLPRETAEPEESQTSDE